jgi:hypothetical protein
VSWLEAQPPSQCRRPWPTSTKPGRSKCSTKRLATIGCLDASRNADELMSASRIEGGRFRREVQPRRQHRFLNEKSGFPFRMPALCSVSTGQRRLGEKEYRAPSVTQGVALRPRTQGVVLARPIRAHHQYEPALRGQGNQFDSFVRARGRRLYCGRSRRRPWTPQLGV